MVTKFSAREARVKAENAKQTLEEQKRKNDELNKQISKERAIIKKGFSDQSIKIISAAIEGNTEVELTEVFLSEELLNLGLEVLEVGLVKKQSNKRDKDSDVLRLKVLKNEILECFDEFIDKSKRGLKNYYDGFSHFHKSNYDALYEAINTNWEWREFFGDDIYSEEVPDDLKDNYSHYIEKINKKIKEYKNLHKLIESDIEDDFDENELITGEYSFLYDEVDDLQKPSVEGNKFKIKWTSDDSITFMNDPILSDNGLAWLSGYRGQNLIEEIFNTLSYAADLGKTSLKLNFSLTKDGWVFLALHRKLYCCMPDELVDIISREDFIIDDTTSSQKSYSIHISW